MEDDEAPLEANFGWLPDLRGLVGTAFQIHPLENSRAAFDAILQSTRTTGNWCYPPFAPASEPEPLVYAEWFSMPSTHRLQFHGLEDDALRLASLIVETLGLIKGMQLLVEGWGHFYRTPIKVHTLGDALARDSAASRILDLAIEFWRANIGVRKNTYGVVHWHQFGPSYKHPFEQFAVEYMVLDTCWAIHKQLGRAPAGRTLHAERLPAMCAHYDIRLPRWAVVTSDESRLSELRNEYFHESRWGGEPIGISHPRDVPSIHVELFCLNTRLILALLGDTSSYTRSEVTLQTTLLD